jgi:two-component system cell cycle response regulator
MGAITRKVLLIDDDRLQHRLVQAHFARFGPGKYSLEWAQTYEAGLEKLLNGDYAACLLDFQLGERDGLTLIREAVSKGCRVPIIFLTAETSEGVDIQAMDAGALDYLVKGEINTRSLERSLRYALKLGETLDKLHRLATRDELTGLLNRREFDRILAEEEERARRFGRSLGIVLLDLDHFKNVNDTYGHPAGDAVIRAAAARLTASVRTVDRVARYGGEEFAVMLAEVDGRVTHEAAKRMVAAMGAEHVVLPDGLNIHVTMSAGSACFPVNAETTKRLIVVADQALYRAKADGRNRAVAAS